MSRKKASNRIFPFGPKAFRAGHVGFFVQVFQHAPLDGEAIEADWIPDLSLLSGRGPKDLQKKTPRVSPRGRSGSSPMFGPNCSMRSVAFEGSPTGGLFFFGFDSVRFPFCQDRKALRAQYRSIFSQLPGHLWKKTPFSKLRVGATTLQWFYVGFLAIVELELFACFMATMWQ